MDKKTKVVMSAKWWKNNKAKTLKDSGKLDKALVAYEKTSQAVGATKGKMLFALVCAVLDTLDAIDKAAAINAKACIKKLHDDTKIVLTGSFKDEVAKLRKGYEKRKKDLISEFEKLKLGDVLKDRTLRVEFVKYGKKRLVQENINYLITTIIDKKMNQQVYDEYIVARSSQELNLPSELRDRFGDAFAGGGKPTAKDWKDVQDTIVSLVNNNSIDNKEFSKWLQGTL